MRCVVLLALLLSGVASAGDYEKYLPAMESALADFQRLEGFAATKYLRFSLNDIDQLRACVDESEPLRGLAKGMMKRMSDFPLTLPGTFDLRGAAWDAHAAVYCSYSSNDSTVSFLEALDAGRSAYRAQYPATLSE